MWRPCVLAQHGVPPPPCAGLAVLLPFPAQFFQCCTHHLGSPGHHFRIDQGLDCRAQGAQGRSSLGRTPRQAQFIGPTGTGSSAACALSTSRDGKGLLSRTGTFPYHQQLRARRIEQGRETRLDTGPARVIGERLCLLLPVLDIGLQHLLRSLGVPPRFGGQHLDALGQQHCCFTLHLHAVLQILDPTFTRSANCTLSRDKEFTR